MTIEEKLLRTRFVVDTQNPHIRVNASLCSDCREIPCIHICPVQCYRKEEEQLICSWENCIECGSCHLACPKGAIDWSYPRGGFGVCYRYG